MDLKSILRRWKKTENIEIDPYSSHLPVFKHLFQLKKFSRILEFGLGFGSTPFFLENCDFLTSIEMQSENFYKKVYEVLKDDLKWDPKLAIGPEKFHDCDISFESYDLVFVDGHGDSRPEVINHFFGKCSTIVTHDYETSSYRWHLIQKPNDYKIFVCNENEPYTAIFTKDLKLYKAILNGPLRGY